MCRLLSLISLIKGLTFSQRFPVFFPQAQNPLSSHPLHKPGILKEHFTEEFTL